MMLTRLGSDNLQATDKRASPSRAPSWSPKSRGIREQMRHCHGQGNAGTRRDGNAGTPHFVWI